VLFDFTLLMKPSTMPLLQTYLPPALAQQTAKVLRELEHCRDDLVQMTHMDFTASILPQENFLY
jgi:hypothetical protein